VVYKSYINILNSIDLELAKSVAGKVGGDVPSQPGRPNHGKKSKGMSQTDFMPKEPTILSRRIAILVADGFNEVEMQAVRAALTSSKAVCYVIGPRRGRVHSMVSQGVESGVSADHHFEGQRSTLFDAIYIPSGAEHVKALAKNGRVIHWVRETFGHCKPIGAVGEGANLNVYD